MNWRDKSSIIILAGVFFFSGHPVWVLQEGISSFAAGTGRFLGIKASETANSIRARVNSIRFLLLMVWFWDGTKVAGEMLQED